MLIFASCDTCSSSVGGPIIVRYSYSVNHQSSDAACIAITAAFSVWFASISLFLCAYCYFTVACFCWQLLATLASMISMQKRTPTITSSIAQWISMSSSRLSASGQSVRKAVLETVRKGSVAASDTSVELQSGPESAV